MPRGNSKEEERQQQKIEIKERAWVSFRPKLEALQTYQQAKDLVTEAPLPDSPGRIFYTNLDLFIQSYIIPCDSNYAEKELYLLFIEKLESNNYLDSSTATNVKEKLKEAMDTQTYW